MELQPRYAIARSSDELPPDIFRFTLRMSGDEQEDRRRLADHFRKAVDAYFLNKITRQKYSGPDRY